MSSVKSVLVIGTGTIGEPLIGLLCDIKEQVGIDEVLFHSSGWEFTSFQRRSSFAVPLSR